MVMGHRDPAYHPCAKSSHQPALGPKNTASARQHRHDTFNVESRLQHLRKYLPPDQRATRNSKYRMRDTGPYLRAGRVGCHRSRTAP